MELPLDLNLAAILVFGMVLGLKHALEPDHLAAVSTLVAHQRNWRAATWQGIVWGIGHMAVILVIGSVAVSLRFQLPGVMENLDFLVALALMVNGVLIIRRARSVHTHAHRHNGRGWPHVHVHVHVRPDGQHEPNGHHHHYGRTLPTRTALLWGLFQGLAGTAAVTVLVASAIPNPGLGVVFLAAFCFSTVAVMGLLSALAGVLLTYTVQHAAGVERVIRMATAAFSFGFGFHLLLEQAARIASGG